MSNEDSERRSTIKDARALLQHLISGGKWHEVLGTRRLRDYIKRMEQDDQRILDLEAELARLMKKLHPLVVSDSDGNIVSDSEESS